MRPTFAITRLRDCSVEIGKNLALAIRPLQERRRKDQLRTGYDVTKNDPEYVQSVFAKHFDAWSKRSLDPPTHVLEIGPGGNTAVAELFLAAGAETATCIDVTQWAAPSPAVRYVCPAGIETVQFPPDSFDFIYSQAVMEHVHDPRAAYRNMATLLRRGGITSHQIDLRDHRDFSNPLSFLAYSERTWQLMYSRRLWYTNRWRRGQHVVTMRDSGLEPFLIDDSFTCEVTADQRERMAQPFRAMPLDDLGVLSIHVVAVRA